MIIFLASILRSEAKRINYQNYEGDGKMSKKNVNVSEEFEANDQEYEEQEVHENDEEQGFEEVDFSDFVSSQSEASGKSMGEAGVLSIVNSDKNGRRITISKEVLAKLGYPAVVQISFTETAIAIGEELPSNDNYFNVRKYGAKGVIYSTHLVQEVVEKFDLDYSNRVSITFHKVTYTKIEGVKVAIITVA